MNHLASFADWAFEPFPERVLAGSILDRFRDMVERHPARIAVTEPDRSITYAEFGEAVERLGGAISAAVTDRPGPVAILLPNDGRYVRALRGVLAAGRGFVPLDSGHPHDRNVRIARLSGAAAIVTAADAMRTAGALFGDLPAVDVDEPRGYAPARSPGPEDLAWITYPSGSTGNPKGVYQNHGNVLADIALSTEILRLSCADRLCLFVPPSHIQGSRIVLGALPNGAAGHPLSFGSLTPADVAAEIRRHGITVFRSVATIFTQVAATLADGERFDSLRIVYLGGDRVSWSDYDRFLRVCPPGAVFGTHLGATECSTYLHWLVDPALRPSSPLLPLGRPLPGRTVQLLDDDNRPAADGEAGEFVVSSSRFNALGYWNDPDLSARAFTPDPGDPQARVYRTGDLGRRRPDGLFEFVGRKDQQVKISGIRIEPGEVETALRGCSGIGEAALVVRRDEAGVAKALIAYVEPLPGTRGLKSRHVMAMASQVLPRQMRPAQIFVEDALPRLPNFKIDRARLAALDAARASNPASIVLDPLTAGVIRAFERALSMEGVAAEDNLMSLGADSLQGLEVIEELEALFGIAVPDDVFAAMESIRELAGWIEAEKRAIA